MECPTTETGPQLCVLFRAGPSLNAGSTVATAASFRPSAIFCVTSVKSQGKLLKPPVQTVAQNSPGQQHEMGTCSTRSARQRGKDRPAAIETEREKKNKTHEQKRPCHPKEQKPKFGLHLGPRYQRWATTVGNTLQPPIASFLLFLRWHISVRCQHRITLNGTKRHETGIGTPFQGPSA